MRSTLNVGAGYDRDRVTRPNRTTQSVTGTANMTTVLPYGILARLNLLFHWIDQVEQRSLGVGPTLSLSYRYGQLRFQLDEQLSWRQTESKSSSNRTTRELINSIFFRIERPF